MNKYDKMEWAIYISVLLAIASLAIALVYEAKF